MPQNKLDNKPEKKREKIKFIRKEWARVRGFFDRLPQVWFLIGGTILFALTFGVTFYETLVVNLFGM